MKSVSSQAKEEIQRRLDEAVAAKKAPALIYGVTSSEGELLWAQAGLREVGNPQAGNITPDSVLWICSQTKMITSIAIYQLIEAGKLTLDTAAADILPELANPIILDENKPHHPAKGQILIRHLLNHTSGVFYGDELKNRGECPVGYLPLGDAANSKNGAEAREDWFRSIRGDLPGFPLKFEPGTSWEYGYSSDILLFIVEKVTGQSAEEYFKASIFKPLGMSSTSFYLTPDLEKRYVKLAVRTARDENVPYNNQWPIMELDPKKVSLHFGGVGVFASARDYLTLLRHLLQILDGSAQNPILKAESLKQFFEPTLTSSGSEKMDAFFRVPPFGRQHGLGLGVENLDKGPDRRKKGTGYWSGWAGTIHYLDPQTGIAVYAGTQLGLPPQLQVAQLWEELEPILYKGLS